MTRLPRSLYAFSLVSLILATTTPAAARVLSIEVERCEPLLGGAPFPGADPTERGIAYELIEGRVYFGFDPASEANARVTDIRLAPLNAQGLVEADAEFAVLQAIDPAQRSGTALIDVPNRGRRLVLGGMNRVQKGFMAPATLAPDSPADWGDGFLMAEGLSVMWVGWQADAPRFPGAMGLNVPNALSPDGTPIEGLARSDWVVDEATKRLDLAALGHRPHLAAKPTSNQNILTRRSGREAVRLPISRASWQFTSNGDAILATDAAFEAGWIYELVYVAESPPLVGLGFAAFRDFGAFVQSEANVLFSAKRAIAHGISQSGRFLRHFLYDGFNRDESNRTVFEGAMIHIAGAGRGGFNHRFSHPGRVGNPYANFFYPGDEFPFTSREIQNGAIRDGLLNRAAATTSIPKLFQINTGYEYWGRGASLIHMTPDGKNDVPPHDRERLFHLASVPHYPLPFPPNPRAEVIPGLFVGSSIDTSPIQRALLLRLLAWVEDGVAPPASLIPTLAAQSLVRAEDLEYPVAFLSPPRSPHVAYGSDFGPRRAEGIVDHQPPTIGAAYAIRVPAIDAMGSEATGIRSLELRVPIGTYTPWALRFGKPGGSDEMTGYIGSFLPLAKNGQDRQHGDTRGTLDALYPSRDDYETDVMREIDALVEEGWMLLRDRQRAFVDAMSRWDWAQSRASY